MNEIKRAKNTNELKDFNFRCYDNASELKDDSVLLQTAGCLV